MARGLCPNTAIATVDLSHCEIGPRGTMVLADMLKENLGLRKLSLSGNPIGRRGGGALLAPGESVIK